MHMWTTVSNVYMFYFFICISYASLMQWQIYFYFSRIFPLSILSALRNSLNWFTLCEHSNAKVVVYIQLILMNSGTWWTVTKVVKWSLTEQILCAFWILCYLDDIQCPSLTEEWEQPLPLTCYFKLMEQIQI